MNQIAHSPKQLTLIKQTIASDCNDPEFNLFMEAAQSYKLDPFRKQIIPLVFSKDDAQKRRMSIVVSRDGLRVIAQRCGNYRPASEPAQFVYNSDLESPLNPKGIVSVSVKLWQADAKSNWFEVNGEADWDEFAPVRGRGKNQWLEGNWQKMPKVMIAKCAEAQALRAGWPDLFSGIYVEEEMDRAKAIDLNATEIVKQQEEENRLRLAQADKSITVFWGEGFALENVPLGQFVDRVMEFIEQTPPADVIKWADMNRASLLRFWGHNDEDALHLKEKIEEVREKASRQPAANNFDKEEEGSLLV